MSQSTRNKDALCTPSSHFTRHVRLDNPLFSHILFPVYLAVLAWGSLRLKNERLRKLILNK